MFGVEDFVTTFNQPQEFLWILQNSNIRKCKRIRSNSNLLCDSTMCLRPSRALNKPLWRESNNCDVIYGRPLIKTFMVIFKSFKDVLDHLLIVLSYYVTVDGPELIFVTFCVVTSLWTTLYWFVLLYRNRMRSFIVTEQTQVLRQLSSDPGFNFTNISRETFTHADPKSAKIW